MQRLHNTGKYLKTTHFMKKKKSGAKFFLKGTLAQALFGESTTIFEIRRLITVRLLDTEMSASNNLQ